MSRIILVGEATWDDALPYIHEYVSDQEVLHDQTYG